MSYIKEFETEFTKKLLSSEKSETIVRWVCEKLLESYRNGITAGRNGDPSRITSARFHKF